MDLKLKPLSIDFIQGFFLLQISKKYDAAVRSPSTYESRSSGTQTQSRSSEHLQDKEGENDSLNIEPVNDADANQLII